MDNKNFVVMIVDDEGSIRGMLTNRLAKEGYTMEEAASAEEALHKFMETGNMPHIIFSDIRMTGMTGVEFLSAVKKLNTDVEFIIMTSYTTAETAVQAVRLGAYDYISKDEFDNPDTIAVVCNRVVEKIKMKYQNIFLLEKMKKQNETLEKKTQELIKKSEQLDRLNKSVMKSQIEAEQRFQLSNKLFSMQDPNSVLKAACELMASFYEKTSCLAMSLDSSNNTLNTIASFPEFEEKYLEMKIEFAKDFDTNKLKFILDTIESYPDFETIIKTHFKTDNFMCHQLLFKNNVPGGVFTIIADKEVNISKLPNLKELIMQLSTAYENAVLTAKINDMAIKDGLTSLFNHKHFMERLDGEVKRAVRYKLPLSILFFDIDHFKKFNDLNGHQVGDAVLKKISAIIQQTSRSMDFLAVRYEDKTRSAKENAPFVSRYGGEEFAIILPNTNLEGAKVKGERLRQIIEKEDFPCQEKQPLGTLTISMGVAEVSEKVSTAEQLILVSDAALYSSKSGGRNRVTIADEKIIETVLTKGKLEL